MIKFDELCSLIKQDKEVWVEIIGNIVICLIDVEDETKKILRGTYFPCIKQAKKHSISYEKIIRIVPKKNKQKSS